MRDKRKIFILLAIVAAAVLALALGYLFLSEQPEEIQKKDVVLEDFVHFTPTPTPVPEKMAGSKASVSETAEEEYISPIDFSGLWEYNTDIYAWLTIPGSDVSYPVIQSDEDDRYYLTHDWKNSYTINGSLYTEASYNSRDFTDPVTVVYGHNMNNGDMFGVLRSMYSYDGCLDDYGEIVIYLPEREMHLTVFAALPFDNRHILYNYDFTDQRTRELFFNDVFSVRAVNAFFDGEYILNDEGEIVILSTCIAGNSGKRFLIFGQVPETEASHINR